MINTFADLRERLKARIKTLAEHKFETDYFKGKQVGGCEAYIYALSDLSELEESVRTEMKRHEEEYEKVTGRIGLNHGLLAEELRDILWKPKKTEEVTATQTDDVDFAKDLKEAIVKCSDIKVSDELKAKIFDYNDDDLIYITKLISDKLEIVNAELMDDEFMAKLFSSFVQTENDKLKKLLDDLKDIHSQSTELISLYLTPDTDITNMIQRLQIELNTVSFSLEPIDENVIGALKQIIQFLTTYSNSHQHVPPNGMAVFCGHTIEGEHRRTQLRWIEPPQPIIMESYRCDQDYSLYPLWEMLKETDADIADSDSNPEVGEAVSTPASPDEVGSLGQPTSERHLSQLVQFKPSISYDEDADVLYISFTDPPQPADDSMYKDGCIFRFDVDGNVIGVTIVNPYLRTEINCDRQGCLFNENGKCSSIPEIDENGLCKEVDVDVSSLVPIPEPRCHSNQPLICGKDSSDLIIRKVKVLQGRLRELADGMGLEPNDLVIVKATVNMPKEGEHIMEVTVVYELEKIEGSPIKYLQDKYLKRVVRQ